MKKAVIFVVLFMLVGFNLVSAIPVSSANVERDFIQDVAVKNSQGSQELENAPPVEVLYDWDSGADGMAAGTVIGIDIPRELDVADQTVNLLGDDESVYGNVTLDSEKLHGELEITKDIPANLTGGFSFQAGLVADDAVLAFDMGNTVKQVAVKSVKKGLKSAITAPILTDVALTDSSGKVFTEENRPTVDSAAHLAFEWALPDALNVKNGDTYTFKLPEIFKLYSVVNGTLGDYGTFVAGTDGTVTMTFNENVETDSGVTGTLQFNTRFDGAKENTLAEQTIVFPVAESQSFEVHFVPTGVEKVMSKSGTVDQAYGPSQINWKVRVNEKQDVLRDAVLKDAIPTGLRLDTESIAVYKLDVFTNGDVKVGGMADKSEYTISKNQNDELKIMFVDGSTGSYEVRYTTLIEDASKKQFVNTAEFVTSGKPTSATGTVTVERGEHLAKQGVFDAKTGRVMWTVGFNFDNADVAQADAVLHDLFDATHRLVDGSVVVRHVSVDGNGAVSQGDVLAATDYSVIPQSSATQNGFDLHFTDGVKTAYQVTYETELVDPDADVSSVVNRVGTADSPEKTATVSTATQNIAKRLVDADYHAKIMKWEQRINEHNYALDNAVIRDSFASGGLEILDETLKLMDRDNGDALLVVGEDYTWTADEDGFTITLLNSYAKQMTHELVLTYDTSFQLGDATVFKNDTRLEWSSAGGGTKTSTDSVTTYPDYYTQKNGFKLGNYDAQNKEITWKIGFNYNLLTIAEPILKDVIPSNQKLVADSVEVHKMELGKEAYNYSDGGVVNPSEYTLDTNDNTVTITFKNGISEGYYATFKTSLDGKLVSSYYLNEATLSDGTKSVADLDGFVLIPNGGSYVGKTGTQDGENIHWNATVNAGQSTISNAKITDTPSSNQVLLPDTIKVYGTVMESSGYFAKGAQLVEGEDYALTMHSDAETGKQSFEIAFSDTISTAYMVQYDTFIDAGDDEIVKNGIRLTGDNLTTEPTQTATEVKVRFSDGSGGATGERGALTLHKADGNSKRALAGAEFGLYNKDGSVLLRTATSDIAGEILFGSLRYGDYTVKELNAPSGYFKSASSEAGIAVTVNSKNQDLTVENEAFVGEAKLTKFEKGTTERLADATFSLMKGAEVIQTDLKTDENGEIVVRDLEPGDYSFVETAAPQGYKINAEPQDFTIGEKQKALVNVIVEDEVILGTLLITKQDHTTKMPLSGAIFDLQDSDGNTVKSGVISDFEGKIEMANLPLGNYNLVETQAPTDYVRGDTAIPITISKATSERNLYYETVDNELAKGGVILTKTDSVNAQKHLAGAIFDLKDVDGNAIQTNLTTDKNGVLVVADLEPGDYSFVETAAPQGYKLDATPLPFSIVKSQQEFVNVAVSNEILAGPEELPTPNVPGDEVEPPSGEAPQEEIPRGETPQEVVTPNGGSPQKVVGNPVVTPVGSQALPTIKAVKPEATQSLPTTGDTQNETLIWLGWGLILMSGIYLSRRQK
ncbi:LPXTG cell wall anchor domain-containing protein [Listeria weihenstephanensis]|uniref:LPXTG cell wall anchor domain-containing protein n=1 Tax=Listeria weihenstephanensis TaxID=1006155 RepID=A0A841Z6R2_9LIST|nr:LPXTG cell wall anchor domain-containing protein [Listeria weihenstephanensis]MBC1500147.1 LPXTG cell wall anchor domain-containing protein [Listeria weihenstephanensis]